MKGRKPEIGKKETKRPTSNDSIFPSHQSQIVFLRLSIFPPLVTQVNNPLPSICYRRSINADSRRWFGSLKGGWAGGEEEGKRGGEGASRKSRLKLSSLAEEEERCRFSC